MAAYSVKPGVKLTQGMRSYAGILAGKVPAIPLTVTSGERDPDEQASAMLHKYNAKGAAELYGLYKSSRSLIDELIRAPKTREAWSKIIRAKGQRLSRHLWKGAMDLRSKGLTGVQIRQVMDAVKATGGRALLEYDHIHVDLPAAYAAASGVEAIALPGLKLSARRGVWALVGGTLALGVLAAYHHRRRPVLAVVGPTASATATRTPSPATLAA